MSLLKKTIASLALLVGVAPTMSYAQGVGVPAAPPVPGVAAPPAAPPATIWSKLIPTPAQKAACKEKICRTAIGQMLNNMLKPIGMFSGGLIGPFCPEVTAEDLAKPPTSAEGAAARAKADAAAAAERREAVRYLGTLDCRYWPEAEAALINALRADRSECVRLEAALALNRGCCCTKNIIKALALTVSGGTDDGNPAECSHRVKAVANVALQRCLECYVDITPAPEQKQESPKPKPSPEDQGEKPDTGEKPKQINPMEDGTTPVGSTTDRRTQTDDYYRRVALLSDEQLLHNARKVLKTVQPVAPVTRPQQRPEQSVVTVVQRALSDRPVEAPVPVTVHQPMPVALPQPRATTIATQQRFAAQQAPREQVKSHREQSTSHDPRTVPTTDNEKTEWAHARSNTLAPSVRHSENQQTAPVQQRTARAAQQTPPTIAQLLAVLTGSSDARHRTWAAQMLSAHDGHSNPQIVAALVGSAHRDESPATRIACLRSLVRLNVRSKAVLSIIQGLQSDTDANVRKEALRASQMLGSNRVTAAVR